MSKVAIVQNRIHKGGRLQVILAIVEVLNSFGITPDLLTFHSQISESEIRSHYGKKITCDVREIFVNPRIPYEWNILLFNTLLSLYKREYELFINSSNSSLFLPKDIPLISYIHYPRKDRVLSGMKSINFPDGKMKSWFDIEDLSRILVRPFYYLERLNRPQETLIANSRFTRRKTLQHYPLSRQEVRVIYPPVRLAQGTSVSASGKEEKSVVTLGRFSAVKRQLEQIQVASELEDFTFYLVGFVKPGSGYYQRCQALINEDNIGNVHLVPNAAYDEMAAILRKARFFLHSNRNEPFGITTVQAIAHGCIPVVHDSGGQKEIVPNPELRYSDVEEAVEIFKRLSQQDNRELQELLNPLEQNSAQYSEEQFRDNMREVLTAQIRRL